MIDGHLRHRLTLNPQEGPDGAHAPSCEEHE
jgi:hypothetical protein